MDVPDGLAVFYQGFACSSIAEVFAKASHDCLTRMLNGNWSGQTLLDVALRVLFKVVGGYLIVEDTVVEKPYAQLLNEAGWVWSSKRNKVVYGVSVVLLVWTDGQIRIPLGFRMWKQGGPSKFELALELLSRVSLQHAPDTDPGLWLVFCVPAQEEPML